MASEELEALSPMVRGFGDLAPVWRARVCGAIDAKAESTATRSTPAGIEKLNRATHTTATASTRTTAHGMSSATRGITTRAAAALRISKSSQLCGRTSGMASQSMNSQSDYDWARRAHVSWSRGVRSSSKGVMARCSRIFRYALGMLPVCTRGFKNWGAWMLSDPQPSPAGLDAVRRLRKSIIPNAAESNTPGLRSLT